jgi:starvation-inducible DNA-binding protein
VVGAVVAAVKTGTSGTLVSLWRRLFSIQEPAMSRTGANKTKSGDDAVAQPQFKVEYREIQAFGTLRNMPIALPDNARAQSVAALNQLLADTMSLRDMYKKHHWQMSGATFYQLHLLLDKHYEEQAALVDTIAERIMMLGGISIAMAADVGEMTMIPRPPKGREDVPSQLARLLHGHEIIIKEAREIAEAAADAGDDGTNDMVVGDIIITHESQVWFIAEHLAETALTRADI